MGVEKRKLQGMAERLQFSLNQQHMAGLTATEQQKVFAIRNEACKSLRCSSVSLISIISVFAAFSAICSPHPHVL